MNAAGINNLCNVRLRIAQPPGHAQVFIAQDVEFGDREEGWRQIAGVGEDRCGQWVASILTLAQIVAPELRHFVRRQQVRPIAEIFVRLIGVRWIERAVVDDERAQQIALADVPQTQRTCHC